MGECGRRPARRSLPLRLGRPSGALQNLDMPDPLRLAPCTRLRHVLPNPSCPRCPKAAPPPEPPVVVVAERLESSETLIAAIAHHVGRSPAVDEARGGNACAEILLGNANNIAWTPFRTPERVCGRIRRVCRPADLCTPYDKLRLLPNAESHLKAGVTFAALDAEAHAVSDLRAARMLNTVRDRLFQAIGRDRTAARANRARVSHRRTSGALRFAGSRPRTARGKRCLPRPPPCLLQHSPTLKFRLVFLLECASRSEI